EKPYTDDIVRLSGTIIQAGSKSFATAAKIFNPETRASAYLLYAWCRHCDDVIDCQNLGYNQGTTLNHDPAQELITLKKKTNDALTGLNTDDPIFYALQKVVAKNNIPRIYPLVLLDGFAMDVNKKSYQTIDDTLDYCYHVAGVVGVMMSLIMGAKDDVTLDRACDLGLAFQLTNIARDVIEDAQNGRVYLPEDWLISAGLNADPNDILQESNREKIVILVTRLLKEAEKYYDSSLSGLSKLGFRSSWAIAAAHNAYRQIGIELSKKGTRAWDRRVATTKYQKLISLISGLGLAIYAHTILKHTAPYPREGLWTRPKDV
ncbi:MAG: phytoene/squalene synthase family protein, partial [Methylocystis sp.]